MFFRLKDSTKVKDCEKSDMSLIYSLLQAVKEVFKPTFLKHFRLDKLSRKKVRPIQMFFKDLDEKKVFLSILYKLNTVGKELQCVYVGHDLSP